MIAVNRRDEIHNFFLWGWTTYGDTLTSDTHQTRFCWGVNQIVFSPDGQSARLSHALCSEGNCADKQCTQPEKQTIQVMAAICKADATATATTAPPPTTK